MTDKQVIYWSGQPLKQPRRTSPDYREVGLLTSTKNPTFLVQPLHGCFFTWEQSFATLVELPDSRDRLYGVHNQPNPARGWTIVATNMSFNDPEQPRRGWTIVATNMSFNDLEQPRRGWTIVASNISFNDPKQTRRGWTIVATNMPFKDPEQPRRG